MDGDDENQKQQMMMTVRTLQYKKQVRQEGKGREVKQQLRD